MRGTIDYLRGYDRSGRIVADSDMILARSRHKGRLPPVSREVLDGNSAIRILVSPEVSEETESPAVDAAVRNLIRFNRVDASTLPAAIVKHLPFTTGVVGDKEPDEQDAERRSEESGKKRGVDFHGSTPSGEPLSKRTTVPDGSPESHWNLSQPSRGLGDTVAKVIHATGLDKLAPKGCGCKKRQAALNAAVPYRSG